MLRLMHVDEINELLLRLPMLVQAQEQRSPTFPGDAKAWLKSLEAAFSASRLYQAGSVAALRSGFVAAEHGQVPQGLEFRGRATRTRVVNAAASQALHRAADLAAGVVSDNQPRFAEAERLAAQIVAAAWSRQLIAAREDGDSNSQCLAALRHSLTSHSDLENGLIHLEGLVGPHDALVFLDRALTPYLSTTARATVESARLGTS